MGSNNNPTANTQNLVIRNLGGETLVYDQRSHKAFCLNKTAALIWNECDGTADLHGLKTKVEKRFGVSIPLDLITLAIDDLIDQGLVKKSGHQRLDRTSRREMIRKIAITTAIALPLISSVVSPTAVRAQSCIGAGTAAPGTPVNAFTDNGGCEFFLNDMCCSGAVNNYEFTLCCSFPQQDGIGTCTGTCA